MSIEILASDRIARAKRAFTTRRVAATEMQTLIVGSIRPSAGDLVLASVEMLGKHKRIELPDGRRANMFPGDEIVVCFGNRYAPDQFEAVIGEDLAGCDLVAAGGIASCELSRHGRMSEPTRIRPLGLLGDGTGRRLNLKNFCLPNMREVPAIPYVLSVGTSMNAGKTLTATSMVHGLKRAGFRVAGIKATGTGAGGDLWIMRDAGADVVLDFTDVGFASTYLAPVEEIEAGAFTLINHAARLGCEVAIIEIADGLQQLETAALMRSERLREGALGVVFAAYDAMGAKYGVDTLEALGHRVIAVSGRLAQAPLAIREAESATGLRVYTPLELQEGALVETIMGSAGRAVARASLLANGLIAEAASSRLVSACGARAETAPEAREPLGGPVPFQVIETVGRTGGSPNVLREVPNSRPPRIGQEFDMDFLREILALVAERTMALEVEWACGAKRGERSSERMARRNGYRRRLWESCLGPIELNIPRLRNAKYRPAFLADQRIVAADVAAAIREGSTPTAIGKLIEAMGISWISDHELSILSAEVEAKAKTYLSVADGGAGLMHGLSSGQAGKDAVRPRNAGPVPGAGNPADVYDDAELEDGEFVDSTTDGEAAPEWFIGNGSVGFGRVAFGSRPSSLEGRDGAEQDHNPARDPAA